MKVKIVGNADTQKGVMIRTATERNTPLIGKASKLWEVKATSEFKKLGMKVDQKSLERTPAKVEGKQELRASEFSDLIESLIEEESKRLGI